MLGSRKRFWLMIPLTLVTLLGLDACAASSSTGSTPAQPVSVQVTLTDFKIDSSLTTFSVGVPYHFTVTNKGAVNHQALIMAPASGTITADEATKMSLAGIGGNGMAPGATQTFDYTFKQAYPAGKLEIACHLPGHYDAGMHLPIVVK
jgi:uncharacterized cupredoxin-like copper-binding protein